MVAQNVVLHISAEEGSSIVEVYHEKAQQVSEGVFVVPLGDLYAEESRDVVFEVTLVTPTTHAAFASVPLPHALVQLAYNDTIKHVSVGPMSVRAHIARPNDKEVSWSNQYVAIQWLRVRTVQVMERADKLSKDGDLDLAKAELANWIEEFHKEAFEVGAQEDLLVKVRIMHHTFLSYGIPH